MSTPFELRPATPADAGFQFQLYAAAYGGKFADLLITEQQKNQLLRMEFESRERSWRAAFPGAEFQIVEVDGEPFGQFYILRESDRITIIDVMMLPGRRTGIGPQLFRDAIHEGRMTHRRVCAHVMKTNPARELWLKLGMKIVGDDGAYHRIEYRPDTR